MAIMLASLLPHKSSKAAPRLPASYSTDSFACLEKDDIMEMTSASHGPPESDTESSARRQHKLCKDERNSALANQATSMTDVPTHPDGIEYATGMKLGLITLAICLSIFLMALDNAIIANAIPKISDAFGSLSDVGWYGSAYLLTSASFQLPFGKLYTILSVKWVCLTAICIFELGSLICGVAHNSLTLIIGRAIAGLGSAGIMTGCMLIMAHSVPLRKRPLYAGLIEGMYGIASVAGPLLGGLFADKVTWRLCFFINLPIGAIAVVVIAAFVTDPKLARPKESLRERIIRFDPVGTLTLLPSIVCLLLALQWGGTEYSWSNKRIVALFVVFGVLMVGFIAIQCRQQENATVPPRIMKNRTVWAGSIFSFGVGSSFFLLVYYLPDWFQAVQGVSAVESGLRNLPMLISVVVLAMVAGVCVTKFGYYAPFMILGTVAMAVGAGLLSLFKPDTGSAAWVGYQFLFGAGVGMSLQQPLMAVQTVLDIQDIPTGTSVIVFVRTLGGAVFVSVGQSVFTNQLVASLASYVPGLDPNIILTTGATNLQQAVPAASLSAVILAYNEALTRAFLVAAGMAAFSVFGSAFIPWESVRAKKDRTAEEGSV